MRMPSAVTCNRSGISTSSEATLRLHLPGTSTRKLPEKRPNTSTPMSKVPTTPMRSAVIPLLPWLPPKAKLARSTPTAIDNMTRPSLKPKSARPMLGPCKVSGPRLIAPDCEVCPAGFASTVIVSVRATERAPPSVWNEPARKRTSSSPALKSFSRSPKSSILPLPSSSCPSIPGGAFTLSSLRK